MRILFLSRCYFPAVEYGGPIGVMQDLAGSLIERGHTVEAWTTDALTAVDRMKCAPFQRDVNGVRVHYFKTGPGYKWDRWVPGLGSYARRHLSQFDVVHIFGYRDLLAPTVARQARRNGIPYVLEPLGSLLPHLRSLRKKWLYDQTLGRPIVEHASCLIASSVLETEDMAQVGVNLARVRLRPNGLRLEEFSSPPERGRLRSSLGIGADEHVVLFLGRLNPKKGLDLLIRASARVSQPFHLVIAGPSEDPAYLQEVRAKVECFDMRDSVHWIGPVYNEDKLQAFVDADLFVMPSLRENYGIAAAEAIALGTPVIVSSTSGIAPFVQGRAGLVIPPEEGPLAHALESLLGDQALRTSCAIECCTLRRELSWERPVRLQEQIYTEAIAEVSATEQRPGVLTH